MEIRDVIHGSIQIFAHELPIVESRIFQRLRQIKQLGFSENSYPTATHARFIHSLGAMETATIAFDTIFDGPRARTLFKRDHFKAPERLRAIVRLAALLHDSGHGPLSHTTEFAMPEVAALQVPRNSTAGTDRTRKANHEDYTLKLILDSSLTELLNRAGSPYGFTAAHVAALIDPHFQLDLKLGEADFFFAQVEGARVNFRPILSQLISSELDADRMDYLKRDSYMVGVSYGEYDLNWLMGNLTYHIQDGRCYLALQHRALLSFEDFLISRFHMFLMVYFHHKSVIYDEMLTQYFHSPDCDYQLPAQIQEYIDCDDTHLLSHLKRSNNPWAKRIVDRTPYRMLVELHTGIPNTPNSAEEQLNLRTKIKERLAGAGIHYLESSSTGELSKYFRKPGDPIFVRYDNQFLKPQVYRLEECTDVFTRYQDRRIISRLYVAPEQLTRARALSEGI